MTAVRITLRCSYQPHGPRLSISATSVVAATNLFALVPLQDIQLKEEEAAVRQAQQAILEAKERRDRVYQARALWRREMVRASRCCPAWRLNPDSSLRSESVKPGFEAHCDGGPTAALLHSGTSCARIPPHCCTRGSFF